MIATKDDSLREALAWRMIYLLEKDYDLDRPSEKDASNLCYTLYDACECAYDLLLKRARAKSDLSWREEEQQRLSLPDCACGNPGAFWFRSWDTGTRQCLCRECSDKEMRYGDEL